MLAAFWVYKGQSYHFGGFESSRWSLLSESLVSRSPLAWRARFREESALCQVPLASRMTRVRGRLAATNFTFFASGARAHCM